MPVTIAASGWLGVDLFFVLSGFLITSIPLNKRHSEPYYRPFYLRRFWRIVPLYFVVLTIVVLTIVVLTFGGGLSLYLACLFFGANLCPLFGIAVPDPASVFWSLAVEEHFYAVWPIAARSLGKWLPVLSGGIFILEQILRFAYAAWDG